MQLVEVQLRNWRSYRNVTFSFPTVPFDKGFTQEKRVILIGAQNGVGKTSLLTALYLGLFGRAALHLIEGFRISSAKEEESLSYKKLLERTLHRPAQASSDPYAMVRLKFVEEDGTTVIVRRKWAFRPGGKVRDINTPDGEEVLIEVNGQPRQYSSWQEANDRVSELLFPSSVMPCFFFDGEQAQARVEAAGGRVLLGAVETLYGTGLLKELRQSLKVYYDHENAVLRKDVGSIREDELIQKRDDLEKKKLVHEEIATSLTAKRRESDDLEIEYQRLTNEITQLVGDSQTDIAHYSDSIRALQNEQNLLRQSLANGLASSSLPLALGRRGSSVETILKSERVRDEWVHLREAAQGKAQLIVSQVFPDEGTQGITPPLTANQVDVLRNRLEEALQALWSPPPTGCADDYRFVFLKESDRAALLSKVSRIKQQPLPDLQRAVTDWSKVNIQLREAQRRYDAIKDVEPKLQALKEALGSTRDNIGTVLAEINSLETREKDLSVQIKELRAAIGQMEKRQSIADPVRQKLETVYSVMEVLDEAGERLVPLCKSALEKSCTLHLRNMISDEFKKFHVIFDADTEPLLASEDQIVYVAGLGGAQKRVFGLAFTLAIADVSRQLAPIIIDTPVGNMDSIYRNRVLQYVAKAARGQVFILSHDKEVSQEYLGRLEPYIAKKILLTFNQISDGCGETSIRDNAYFGD